MHANNNVPNTRARVNVGGQTSLSSTGDGGVKQLGDQSQYIQTSLSKCRR